MIRIRDRWDPLALYSEPDLRGAGGPGPQASHQQGVSHQTPQFLKPCNSIANPFLESQIRHWAQASHQGPQASHQLNPALPIFRQKLTTWCGRAINFRKIRSFLLNVCQHGRWNRGSRGSSCSPNFWHGRAGHSSCSHKSLSLLHCDVRLSRIDLDILEFCRSVGRSRTKKLSASGGLRPLTPTRGSAPGPRWGLRPQTPVIGSRSTRSPWPRPLLAPPTFKHFQRPCLSGSDCESHEKGRSAVIHMLW